jgi:hypothetical protein
MAASQIAAVAITVAGVVVALWLLIKSARGQALVLGIIGTVLMLLGVLAQFAFQWMADWLFGRIRTDTLVAILAADAVGGAVLTGAGLLLTTRAIVVAGWPAWTDKRANRAPRRSGSAS